MNYRHLLIVVCSVALVALVLGSWGFLVLEHYNQVLSGPGLPSIVKPHDLPVMVKQSATLTLVSGKREDHNVMMSNGKKLYWFELTGEDGQTHVVLPKWYNEGHGTDKMTTPDLARAWMAGHPGIWLMDYNTPNVQEIFKDCIIETVDSKK